MLVLIAAWVVALALLVPVVMGPERYVRKVVRNLRPDAAEPTKHGYALLFWRNLLLLVLAVLLGTGATLRTVDTAPTASEASRATQLAVALVPEDELDAARLDAELRVMTDQTVAAEEVSSRFPDPEQPTTATTVTVTYIEARALTPAESEGEDVVEAEQEDPATCVIVERVRFDPTGVPGYETPEDQYTVSTSPGRCEEYA